MGTDYSEHVREDQSGTIRVAVHHKDLQELRPFLDANRLRHVALSSEADLTELTFSSRVSADAVRKMLKHYARLFL